MRKVLALILAVGFIGCAQADSIFAPPQGPVTSQVVNGTYNLTTASGTQVITGFSFTPSSCDGSGSVTNSAAGVYATVNAHADSALGQSNLGYFAALLNQNNNYFFYASDVTGTNYQLGQITAYGAGSVTVTWAKTGSPTGTFSESLRCFK
jgi:hypothetical protein